MVKKDFKRELRKRERGERDSDERNERMTT